jgi:hypothetical protein
VSVSFGRITQDSFPSGAARTVQGSVPVCPDAGPAGAQREKPPDLLVAVPRAAGRVEVHAVLFRLGIGDRHDAHAGWRVLVSPGDDLALALGQDLPAGCLRPEPGRAQAGRAPATM